MGYSIKLNDTQVGKLIKELKQYEIDATNQYTLFQAKFNNSTVTIFKTQTVLIQGRDEYNDYQTICSIVGITPSTKEANLEVKINHLQSFIGTDEVGTGDVFGGIVVCGAFVDKEKISSIKKLGVKDSKELSDYKILEIAPVLMKEIPYYVYTLEDLKFNYLTSHYHLNMNNIKALCHNNVILNMKKIVKNYDGIIIDAFTTPSNYFNYLKTEKNIAKDVILEEKAENKYISVACASIIARYTFLKHLDTISNIVGFEIPKGAGKPVDTAIKKIFLEKGSNEFKNIAKINFKNFDIYKNKRD